MDPKKRSITTNLVLHDEEALTTLAQRVEDGTDLNGHHRQHFDGNTIELIEAAPTSRLRQTYSGDTSIR